MIGETCGAGIGAKYLGKSPELAREPKIIAVRRPCASPSSLEALAGGSAAWVGFGGV